MVSFSSLYKSMTVTRKALTSIETCFSAKFPGANIRVVKILATSQTLRQNFQGQMGYYGKIKF